MGNLIRLDGNAWRMVHGFHELSAMVSQMWVPRCIMGCYNYGAKFFCRVEIENDTV